MNINLKETIKELEEWQREHRQYNNPEEYFQSCLKCEYLSKNCKCRIKNNKIEVGTFKYTANKCKSYNEKYSNIFANSYLDILSDGGLYAKVVKVWVWKKFLGLFHYKKTIHKFIAGYE